ncbi:MAG: AF1514 family protein [Candidatus Thermoplasmatota archaeon]|nr:AF1514 family protein [Candidatus Thermoplasmatota archaeon]
MATDPVCGMTVNERAAAGSVVHAGRTWYFCSPRCQHEFEAHPAQYAASGRTATAASHSHGMAAASATSAGEKAKDPICGMMVDKATALKSERAGRAYYFCSVGCQRTFESPEQELRSMRTRVTIALTGVLALAILRAGAFLGLATGATIVTWAPIPQVQECTGDKPGWLAYAESHAGNLEVNVNGGEFIFVFATGLQKQGN